MRKRCLITREQVEPVLDALRESFDLTVGRDPLDEAAAAAALREYDAIVPTLGDRFSAAAFEAAGEIRCGVLANFGVGYNHIDVEAARAHGVAVSNTPDVLTDATADIGLLLMLGTARRASEGERLVRAGEWKGFGPKGMLGTDVSGKVLGVAGFGRIGRAVARRGHLGFGMEVLYWNRSAKDPGFPVEKVETLEEMAARVDFLVVCLPGGRDTAGVVGAGVFAAMKREAIFVNIARGEIVDETALIEALESGAIAGAGLDVYEKEPFVPERLRACERCFLLPHLGSATVETRIAMGMVAVANARAWAEGRDLPQAV